MTNGIVRSVEVDARVSIFLTGTTARFNLPNNVMSRESATVLLNQLKELVGALESTLYESDGEYRRP